MKSVRRREALRPKQKNESTMNLKLKHGEKGSETDGQEVEKARGADERAPHGALRVRVETEGALLREAVAYGPARRGGTRKGPERRPRVGSMGMEQMEPLEGNGHAAGGMTEGWDIWHAGA